MKLIHTIPLALLLGIAAGCSSLKAIKYARSGSVSQSAFKTEVAFEMRYGLIVLKVEIHGKEYDFLLDTGAPNIISKELALQLGIKAAGTGKAGDSQGGSRRLEFAAIDSIGIGDLQFLNTGAAIADLKQTNEIPCFKVDGMIGSNLMRKAIWQFDYERHIITITSNRDSLSIPSNAQTIKFHTDIVGVPLIDVQMNGQTEQNVIVDLGSNRDFFSSTKTLEKLKEGGLRTDIYSYGYGATGLFGKGKPDTTWNALIGSIMLDSLKLSNLVVSFCENKPKTIGTNFFKNYRLVIDWSSGELSMIPIRPYDNTSQKEFNFSLFLKDKQVFIGSLLSVGNKVVDGPQLGDQVLEIDGEDYRSCSGERWCTMLSRRFENTTEEISLLVKRGDRS